MSDQEDDLKKLIKDYQESVKNFVEDEVSPMDATNYLHNLLESSFDKKISKLENDLEEDISNEEKVEQLEKLVHKMKSLKEEQEKKDDQ